MSDIRASNLAGAGFASLAVLLFTTNDVGIKFLSGDYALHQIVLIRSLIGTAVFLAVIMPLSGGWKVLRTRRLPLHLARGFCVVIANMSYFLAIAAIPLADAVALVFASPILLSLGSILFLGEKVGPWRWAAIVLGFAGVIVMLRPGSSGFEAASLLALLAACFYASLHLLTRYMRDTESAATMAFYIQVVFIATSGVIGLALGHGAFAGDAHPSVAFLLRGWVVPAVGDWWILGLIGAGSILGGFLISQAYRLAEAAFAAPFEYVAMPMAVLWGVVIFGDWPDIRAWAGMGLIVAAGLLMLWRETRTQPVRR